ncbi:hypothetical protein AVEN_18690-1, partial [Araneus ventricosus]
HDMFCFIHTLLRKRNVVYGETKTQHDNNHIIIPTDREGRCGLVVRSRPRDRRVACWKPDSTEDPPCNGPVAR